MSRLFADLSNNDPDFDAGRYARAGHKLLGYKATEGATFVDKTMRGNVRLAHAHGVRVAFYHFAQPNLASSAAAQARHFWRVVEPEYRTGDFLVLDLEVQHRHGARACRRWARQFHRELRAASGHTAILYTGRSFLADQLGPLIRFGRGGFSRFWVAEYGPKLTGVLWARPVWAWQRTGDGIGPRPHTLPGCPQGCDVNVLNTRTYRRIAR